ncbi:MAG: sel1 repeat family protein, partial [Lentisphaerae bacterium]|nr:sel1 repeat family protein [Lentisphaerota bacterium]
RFYEIMEKDYNLLRTLADKGNGNALYALGVLGIMNQDMKHPDIAIGIELLEKAVKQNSSEACILLGHIHRAGKLVPGDMKKALEYYRKGAEMGNSYSAWWVPLVLTNEKEFADTPHDDVKKAFERCLELNEDRVLQNYGAFMEFTVKDLKKAEELYRLAAAKGDTAAMLRLYHLLSESDPAASLGYLFNAIELEDPLAETEFADHLLTVDGRPRDIYGRYLSAYWHGDNVHAPAMLATCYLNGFGCEPNSNMFWKFSDIAYKNGSAEICLALGDVFRDGKITPKNLKKAREYYTEGVKRGNQSCRKALDSLK